MNCRSIRPSSPASAETDVNQKEFRLACSCADGVRRGYSYLADYFTHFPAGEKRSKVTGARLKRQGLGKGWPDYQFMVPLNGYHGLFIELKVDDNNPGPEQKDRIAALRRQGYAVALGYTFDEFFEALDGYLANELGPLFRRVTRTKYISEL